MRRSVTERPSQTLQTVPYEPAYSIRKEFINERTEGIALVLLFLYVSRAT
jgi:hypothetical protein